jgi:hypothetical protein
MTGAITVPLGTGDIINAYGSIGIDAYGIELTSGNFNGNWFPKADNAYKLGQSGYGFSEVWTRALPYGSTTFGTFATNGTQLTFETASTYNGEIEFLFGSGGSGEAVAMIAQSNSWFVEIEHSSSLYYPLEMTATGITINGTIYTGSSAGVTGTTCTQWTNGLCTHL